MATTFGGRQAGIVDASSTQTPLSSSVVLSANDKQFVVKKLTPAFEFCVCVCEWSLVSVASGVCSCLVPLECPNDPVIMFV